MSNSRLETNCERLCFVADRLIGSGETIAYLTGEIVDTKTMLSRVRQGMENVDNPHQIDDDIYILLDQNSAHYSHACDPNAGVQGYNTLFALRDINAGEPITLDFSTVVGTSLFDGIWRMDCGCGAPACRKTIRSVRSLPRDTLKKYVIAGAVPDFIMRQLIEQR